MIFYLANGTTLCGTQAEAKALDKNFVQHDIPTDKSGLMLYINSIMTVNANNDAELIQSEPQILPPTYATVSITIDDEWDKLPLARKLHFAAAAMEEARYLIKA